jgi:cytochrome b
MKGEDANGEDIGTARRVMVWDLPTRLFHWGLVLLVAVSFVTVQIGGNAMRYHELSGFTILALLLFRVLWGVVGGQTSRFVSFVRGPTAVMAYARGLFRGETKPHLGHNPLGGWSILAMLAALLVQAGTGLFANDDIITEGPLYSWVSKATSDGLTQFHRFNASLIVALVLLHLSAVFFYLVFKRENLIKPMITGKKDYSGEAESAPGSLKLALAILLVAAGVVYLIVR